MGLKRFLVIGLDTGGGFNFNEDDGMRVMDYDKVGCAWIKSLSNEVLFTFIWDGANKISNGVVI